MFIHVFETAETLRDMGIDWFKTEADLPKQRSVVRALVDFALRVNIDVFSNTTSHPSLVA